MPAVPVTLVGKVAARAVWLLTMIVPLVSVRLPVGRGGGGYATP